LAASLEQTIDSQFQKCQMEQQSVLETIWVQVTEILQKREEVQRAELKALRENLEARIATLENKVQELQTTKQRAPAGAQPVVQAAQAPPAKTQTIQEKTPLQQQSAIASKQSGRATEAKAPRGTQEKRGATWADLTALLATKPGGNEWQTVPARKSKSQSLKKLTPIKEMDKEARRMIFRREEVEAENRAEKADIILELNKALVGEGLPTFLRVQDAGYTSSGAISVLLNRGASHSMLLPEYRDTLLTAARKADIGVISVEAPEQWYRLKVHGVPVRRYLTLGLGLARQEIETGGELELKRDPVWLRSARDLRESSRKGSTIVITVGSLEEARNLRVNGIRFGGARYKTEHYWDLGPGTVCPRCCGIGHRSFRACGDRPPLCYICAGPHEGIDHTCSVTTCKAKPGNHCQHMPAKCGNCGGKHPATARSCPKQKEAWRQQTKQTAPAQPGRGPERQGATINLTQSSTNSNESVSATATSREQAARQASPAFAVVICNPAPSGTQEETRTPSVSEAEQAEHPPRNQTSSQSSSSQDNAPVLKSLPDQYMGGTLTPRRTAGHGTNWAECV
jgi:hypothetical protein